MFNTHWGNILLLNFIVLTYYNFWCQYCHYYQLCVCVCVCVKNSLDLTILTWLCNYLYIFASFAVHKAFRTFKITFLKNKTKQLNNIHDFALDYLI